jgi:hypothetical protein
MRILFLHGLESQVGGAKPVHLKAAGHDVVEPSLAGTNFEESKIIAQAYVDKYGPEVIVGSSRGGALAMNIDPAGARLVLVAPAWNIYGSLPAARADSTIIHSETDKIIPFEESIQLSKMSGAALVAAGSDHRMNSSNALSAILAAVERQQH